MENLSLSDAPHQGAGPAPGGGAIQGPAGRGPPPPSLPPQTQSQLPAQMFTTAAQLLDLTDKKLMIALRDGRKLSGVLRSWDQFANLVLQSTTERLFVPPGSTTGAPEDRGLYADVHRGLFLVRGENVLLLGEIDLDKDDDPPPGYEKAELPLVEALIKRRKAEEKAREKTRLRKLASLGFEGENMGEVIF